LGNSANNTRVYAIILLSVALLFFPVQQVYGTSAETLEFYEEQRFELRILEQSVKAEKIRDENFVSLTQQNPYLDMPSNVIISFKENNETKPTKSFVRENKNFSLIKDVQLSIAEKKYKEILGGKTILNFYNNEPVIKKSNHEFKIDNKTGFMNRESDDFKKYKLLQGSIAEEFRNNNWKINPYQNNEIKMLPNNEENKIVDTYLNRHSDEFRNLKNEQISIAVNTLNEMPEFRMNGSPYLVENMYEPFDKINKNEIAIEGLELTQTMDKLEINSLNRSAEEFKMSIELELKIAQNKLNEMLLISNPDNNDETIILDDDEKNYYFNC